MKNIIFYVVVLLGSLQTVLCDAQVRVGGLAKQWLPERPFFF